MKLSTLLEGKPRDEEHAQDYIAMAKHGLSGTSVRIDNDGMRIYQETDESEDGLEEPDKYYFDRHEMWPDTWDKLVRTFRKAGVVEESVTDILTFDEGFIRSVAKDRGIDLSDKKTEDILAMHEQILRNLNVGYHDKDIDGQSYYDAVKEFFS